MFHVLRKTYELAMPDLLPPEVVDEAIDSAVGRAREKHSDFDRFLPAIEFLSTVFFTDHRAMPLDAYLETLYCAVKHGDFARPWRMDLKRVPAFAPPDALQ